MRGKVLQCVTDANILFDLHCGEIVQEAFHLPYVFLAPDVIISEMENPPGASFLSYGLQSRQIPGYAMSEISVLSQRYSRPSINDLTALRLAQIEGATLLSGDRHLKMAAVQEGVPVHGTIWLVDEMIHLALIPPGRAMNALQLMQARGRRLPQQECEQRFRRWRSGSS